MSQLSHLIKESHSNFSCIYCSSGKEIMVSEFHDDCHYLSFVCKDCGKKNFVKADFLSSGINIPYDTKEKKPQLEQIVVKEPVLR
jgi:hypothetical protein